MGQQIRCPRTSEGMLLRNRQKPVTDIPLTIKEKMLLKTVLKKVKGTDVEILLKESGLIE